MFQKRRWCFSFHDIRIFLFALWTAINFLNILDAFYFGWGQFKFFTDNVLTDCFKLGSAPWTDSVFTADFTDNLGNRKISYDVFPFCLGFSGYTIVSANSLF